MTTYIQTITEDQLMTRQKRAISALLSHVFVYTGIALWASYVFLILTPFPLQGITLVVCLAFPVTGVPLWLAIQLYRGKFYRKWLQGWAGTYLIIGLFYLFAFPYYLSSYLPPLPSYPLSGTQMAISLILMCGTILFFLVPSGLVLHLTGISTWSKSVDIPPASVSNPFFECDDE